MKLLFIYTEYIYLEHETNLNFKIMKKLKNEKLSINKFQIARIKNPSAIFGGNGDDPITPAIKTDVPKDKDKDKN